ncbi:IS630 family transposase [Mesorhizobium sp. AR02]|uniref:IS630 family transposase n=1 Tax=Mesorhizobium sp. AR02 TaxID=2865837 RepID=UPI00215FD25F|nr:IS630 family transposase [Mesorhizobium sp. AR02]UVK51689.1 IS630 family transposase [Mesorhizobium sp. AR02]UVK56845.1 IS630 family transposase [Mesorhizobium sp. AR02]
MAKPYSMDLRERALARLEEGETSREVAAALKVAVSSVIKWAARKRRLGSAAPGKMGGHRPYLIDGEHRAFVLSEVERDANITLHQLTAALAERGLIIHPASVGRFLHREGKSFKKTILPAEQLKPKLMRRRAQWMRYQTRIDPTRLVFLDETWVKTNMAPLRGWGVRGKRLMAHAPYGHWKTMTFIAALRHDRVEAPWVIDGPINAQAFRAYVETELIKTLKPGDIVILDNLGSHKGQAVRDIVRAAGARLFFLPPYSPDLNPIEKLFAKLKHCMRRAAKRSIQAVHNAIANTLDDVTPNECNNYIESAGYKST